MIEDMTVRNLSPATQRSSIGAVSKPRYFGRSPDTLELEDVRAFQVHLAKCIVSTGNSWPALSVFFPLEATGCSPAAISVRHVMKPASMIWTTITLRPRLSAAFSTKLRLLEP